MTLAIYNIKRKRIKKERGKKMIPAIIKPGTHPTLAVWLKGGKPIKNYVIGDKIIYRPQLEHGAVWIYGRVTGFCGLESDHIPLIELL